ncbi:hypothetical protein OAW63_01260 [Flavobacteriaceae bacterium]|nr:hypothetical protein [Flavobacteriaceae bacterium]
MTKIDCNQIVEAIRSNKAVLDKQQAIKQAYESDDMWEKCVLFRKYTSPQSTDSEKLIRHDFKIGSPIDAVSGDGMKNGINYEIKVSIHDTKCKTNIRQIRPHHNVDFYIIMAFNVFGGDKGEAHIFRVPSEKIYDLVLKYGGYTHGTVKRNGVITAESIRDKSTDFEYSLSADPNANSNSKSKKLWDELMKYSVPYSPNSF